MKAKLFIEELGVELGLTGLTLDANHACTIATDDNLITIQHQPLDATFLVFASVMNVDDGFSTAVLEYVLEANLFGRDTLGMHLGFYAPISALVLSASLGEKERTVQEFMDYLSFFAAELVKWQKNIKHKVDENPLKTGENNPAKPVEEEYAIPITQMIKI